MNIVTLIKGKVFIGMILFLTSCQLEGSDNKIYIDPDNTGSPKRTGSKENPFLSWDEIKPTSNTTYLIKRSAKLILHRPINIYNKSDMTITTYGKGENPTINTGYVDKPFNLHNSERISIQNINIHGNNKSIYCIRILGNSKDINVNNCHLSNALWGIRILGNHKDIQPGNITIRNSRIENIGDDGIYAQYISGLNIDSCMIRKVNQKWFNVGRSESQSPGDGVQLQHCTNFTISNCKIDRTDTGNKFCLIANQSQNGMISGNELKGPSSEGNGGGSIYLGYGTDSVEIHNNNISASPCGIYSHAKNVVLFKNTLKENQIGVWLLDPDHGVIINNTFWNNPVALKTVKSDIYNNIFYSTNTTNRLVYLKEPFSADHNCYYLPEANKLFSGYGSFQWYRNATKSGENSIFSDPLIKDNPGRILQLKKGSPCIDKGFPKLDKWNLSINYCDLAIDIGANEFCQKN